MKLSESSAGVLWALIILAVLPLLPLIGMGVIMLAGGHAMSGHTSGEMMGGQMMGGHMMGGAMMAACAPWGIDVAFLLITLIVAAASSLRSQTP